MNRMRGATWFDLDPSPADHCIAPERMQHTDRRPRRVAPAKAGAHGHGSRERGEPAGHRSEFLDPGLRRDDDGALSASRSSLPSDRCTMSGTTYFHLSLRERSTHAVRWVRVYGLSGWFPTPSPGASLRPLPMGEVRDVRGSNTAMPGLGAGKTAADGSIVAPSVIILRCFAQRSLEGGSSGARSAPQPAIATQCSLDPPSRPGFAGHLRMMACSGGRFGESSVPQARTGRQCAPPPLQISGDAGE